MAHSQILARATSICLPVCLSIFLSAAISIPVFAQAPPPSGNSPKVTSPFFNCSMDFRASGRSVYIGIGYTELSGSGSLNCYDIRTQRTQKIALKVRARGPGAGLGVTGLNISGGATGIGVAERPERLLGHYLMLRGNAAAGVGAAVGSGIRLSNGAATINVSIESQTGLGVGLDLLWIDIIAVDPQEARTPELVVREEPKPPVVPPDELPLPPAVQPQPLTITTASAVPTTTVEISQNQPIQVLDANGKVLQLIYVRQK